MTAIQAEARQVAEGFRDLIVQTQLIIAKELGFGDDATLKIAEGLSNEVSRMLVALMRTL